MRPVNRNPSNSVSLVESPLSHLATIVPPPDAPVERGSVEEFDAVEQQLCLELPPDYKAYVGTYGSGQWHEFWWFLSPFDESQYGNLTRHSVADETAKWSILNAERTCRIAEGEYPYPIYPEPGGILPWAVTENGGNFFWLTIGPALNWPTVYRANRGAEFERIDLTCTEILLGIVTGRLPLFAEPFSDYEHEHGAPFDFASPHAFQAKRVKRKSSRRK